MRRIQVVAVLAAVMFSVTALSSDSITSDSDADIGSSTEPFTGNDIVMPVPGVSDIWVFKGAYLHISFVSSGGWEFLDFFIDSDPNGMVKGGNPIALSGRPTGDVIIDAMYMDVNEEVDLHEYFTIHTVTPTTTTQFPQDTVYAVEGTNIPLSVTGTVANGETYRADLSADGGVLGTDRVESGTTFLFLAPEVDGTTVFHITAVSAVEGAVTSSDVLEVVVVDSLVEGKPSVGRITSD